MTNIRIKHFLLTGTAILAASAFSIGAHAADQTLTGNGTFASAGTAGGTDVGDASDASTGDNVDLDTNTLTITNDGTANDGSGLNTFDVGNITDTDSGDANSGDVTIDTGANSDLTVTIDSIDIENDVTIDNSDGNDANVDVTIEGNLTTGTGNGAGVLTITNNDTDADVDVAVSVDGDLSVAGATAVTANTGTSDGADATLTVTGDATFTGGLTLNDNTGSASLVLDGSAAQNVAGAIVGAGAGEGTITITNNSTVDFAGAVGGTSLAAVNLNNTGVTTFASMLAATNININQAGTLDVDGAVTGDINFAADGDLIVADGLTITGNVDNTSGSNGAGTITLEDTGSTTTITGNVGATNAVDAISIAGAAADVDFQGTVDAATLTLGGAGANVNFQGATDVTTITVSNTGTVDADADLDANVNLSGAGTVDLAATTTLTGAVNNTSGADDSGNLTLATTGGTTTVTGAVGASNTLAAVTVNGTGTAAFGSSVSADDVVIAGAATVNFAGDVVAPNEVDLNNNNATVNFANGADVTGNIVSTGGANGTVNFAGNSTVTGSVGTGAGNAISALAVNGAGSTVSISGDSFVGTIATAANATLVLNGDTTASGAITNGGTTRIGVGDTLTAASFGGAGQYTFDLADDGDDTLNAADFGALASAGAIDLAAETVVFNVTGDLATGAGVVLGAGGGGAVDALSVSDTSLLYDVALAAVGNDHQITVTRNAVAGLTTGGNNQAVGPALDALASSNDTEVGLVLDQLAAATTSAQINDVVEATLPTVDAGAVVAGISVTNQSVDVTNTRLASLRSGTAVTGMTAGNVSQGLKAWGQVFGSTGEQDDRDGVAGYEVDTLGVAAGVDTETLAEDWVVGLAFSYGDTDVDSDNANSTETEVTTYQASLYADYELDNRSYVSGQIGYAWGDNEQTRKDVGGSPGLNAQGEYDSSQIFAYAETGRSYDYGHATITPKLLASYMHYDADGYTETGAGGAGLNVESEELNLFEVGVAADVAWLYKNADGSFTKPTLRAGVRYDVIGDEFETNSNFIAGGGTFKTTGFEPAQTTYDVGAGVTYFSTSNWDLTADYDYEFKEDYSSHEALLRAAYNF